MFNYKSKYKVDDVVYIVPIMLFSGTGKGFEAKVIYVTNSKLILEDSKRNEYVFNKNGYKNHSFGMNYLLYDSKDEFIRKESDKQIISDLVSYIKDNLNKLDEEQLLKITDIIEGGN